MNVREMNELARIARTLADALERIATAEQQPSPPARPPSWIDPYGPHYESPGHAVMRSMGVAPGHYRIAACDDPHAPFRDR
jgi:hypothetical protein